MQQLRQKIHNRKIKLGETTPLNKIKVGGIIMLKNKISSKVTAANITTWLNNYNTFLIENNLIKKEDIKAIKQSTRNLFLSLVNNPDNFTFDERCYIFINKYSKNFISTSLVLGVLKQANETALYLEIHEKTY